MTATLEHVTLNRGHYRTSPRDEVSDDVLAVVAELLRRALAGERPPVPVVEPPCTLRASTQGGLLLVTIETDALDAAAPVLSSVASVPLVTVAVAPGDDPDAATLWRMLHGSDRLPLRKSADRPPAGPWCAVRLEPGALLLPTGSDTLPVIADLERVIAWAWLEEP